MKLNTAQKHKVEEQLDQVEMIDEDSPSMDSLQNHFGNHTFFVDAVGLNIVEPSPESGDCIANVVRVARWTNFAHRELTPHDPEILPLTVDIEAETSNG